MGGNPLWKGQKALLPFDRASVFFDGVFSEPQLNHPECLAFDGEGNIWCGGERGEIFRIDRSGAFIELIASTGGFTLGIALDDKGRLFTCDLKHSAVFSLDTISGELKKFADGNGNGYKIRIPNYPVVDRARGCLYVSDSYDSAEAGPGIWRFDLMTGEGEMWVDAPMRFANGMALSQDGETLYVAETFDRKVSAISIGKDGRPTGISEVCGVEALPDGLALDANGCLYITCYEPSLIYRYRKETGVELLYYDEEAHILCHPTNIAFSGNDLFVANLGRWHITRIHDVISK